MGEIRRSDCWYNHTDEEWEGVERLVKIIKSNSPQDTIKKKKLEIVEERIIDLVDLFNDIRSFLIEKVGIKERLIKETGLLRCRKTKRNPQRGYVRTAEEREQREDPAAIEENNELIKTTISNVYRHLRNDLTIMEYIHAGVEKIEGLLDEIYAGGQDEYQEE